MPYDVILRIKAEGRKEVRKVVHSYGVRYGWEMEWMESCFPGND